MFKAHTFNIIEKKFQQITIIEHQSSLHLLNMCDILCHVTKYLSIAT